MTAETAHADGPTPVDLDALEAKWQAAQGHTLDLPVPGVVYLDTASVRAATSSPELAELIVAAVNALPGLVARVREAEAEADRLTRWAANERSKTIAAEAERDRLLPRSLDQDTP